MMTTHVELLYKFVQSCFFLTFNINIYLEPEPTLCADPKIKETLLRVINDFCIW